MYSQNIFLCPFHGNCFIFQHLYFPYHNFAAHLFKDTKRIAVQNMGTLDLKSALFSLHFLAKSYLKSFCLLVTIEYWVDFSSVVFLNSNSLGPVIVCINFPLDFPTTCKYHMLSQPHQQAFKKELHFRLFMFCSEQQVPVLCQLQNRNHAKMITVIN